LSLRSAETVYSAAKGTSGVVTVVGASTVVVARAISVSRVSVGLTIESVVVCASRREVVTGRVVRGISVTSWGLVGVLNVVA